MRRILAFTLLLVLPLGISAQSIEQNFPNSGVIKGSVMVLAAPPEMDALTKRMQAAMTANAEWFRTYVEKAGSGELPYHKNLGVTEEEYKRFLSLAKVGMTLQKVASVELTLRRSKEGIVTFVASPSDFPLHMVSISANGNVAETPYGRLSRGSDIRQRDANAPTGRWSGPKWEHEEVSGGVALRAQLAIGKRDDFGDGIIYYNVIRQAGSTPERIQLVVLYPLR